MKLFTANMKMADVVHSNYLLIPVVNRFGIRLGFGEMTVSKVCRKHGVDPGFFLTILNTYCNENYFPQKTLQTFNVLTIINYLRKTHSYYIETEIPIIENEIKTLIGRGRRPNRSLSLVKKFFLQYKKELLSHLKREESITFPYIEQVHALFHAKKASAAKRLTSNYSMQQYEEEHDNVDEILHDLKSILIKYIKGDFDQAVCNTIIFELFRLEKDIQDHTRIEETILRPMVIAMENNIRSRAD
jgi:regulator of cell morphogenesis and NO signaling